MLIETRRSASIIDKADEDSVDGRTAVREFRIEANWLCEVREELAMGIGITYRHAQNLDLVVGRHFEECLMIKDTEGL